MAYVAEICDILNKNDINSTFSNIELYRYFSKQNINENLIIDKIKNYNNYINNNKNYYSEEIMKALRENKLNDKFDYSKDNELISMFTKDEVFKIMLESNGVANFDSVIKEWIEEIYNVNLK